MNKKFLSAILFGAMLATSAGTFVSCKDYDDDIKGLQTQIDTNKTAIAELQKLVGAGNWVTSVAASGENLVVTMSNGTTATIAGIKGADGVDGKNAAEWTISEDGFWCKDGEKTTNVAVAQNGKDGKDGLTAPSPTISDNGMWVVYSWDAAKGEFVAEETEIPAAGTSAYAVKANGVYTLYIADADGEMQEIALPATCDAIVVEAPYQTVSVEFEVATWNMSSADAKSDAGKALLAKYPEIADIAKNAPMKQGGMLPLIVTPAAAELTDEFSFSLQNANGKIANIALSAPVKGADMEWNTTGDKLVSRSASDACLWSLSMEPAYDKKKYPTAPHYAATTGKASLVVENEKGTVVRTAYAYEVAPVTISEPVSISGNLSATTAKAAYAESIDLFAPYYENGRPVEAPISFENEYKNHYVIALANALEAERYGLSIAEDGHTLNIAKMPASELSIPVNLTVVALGLNGSVATSTVTLTIGQEIAASEGLTPAEVTLNKKDQIVTWKFEELGLSAVAFENFYKDNVITLAVTREADKNDDGTAEKYFAYYGGIKYYTAKDEETVYTSGTGTWSKGTPAKFGFTVDSDTKTTATLEGYAPEGWTEAVYTATLTSKKGQTTVVYAAQTELTVKNPELTADYVKVVSAFVEDGVFQITGSMSTVTETVNGASVTRPVVTYNLREALILANGASIAASNAYVDYDNYLYVEEGGEDTEDYEYYNWVNGATLVVNKWVDTPETITVDWNAAFSQQMYQIRNIRVKIQLFNEDNIVPFDFQVIVKSEIYSEDGSAVTFDAAKLKAKFTNDPATTTVDERVIKLADAITAKAVAGVDKGVAYRLFELTKGGKDGAADPIYDYRIATGENDALVFNGAYFKSEAAGSLTYLLNSTNDLVQIEESDLKKFGMSALEFAGRDEESKKYYITLQDQTTTGNATLDGLLTLYKTWRKYYQQTGKKAADANGVYECNGKKTVDEEDAVAVELYNKYVVNGKIYVKPEVEAVDGTDITVTDKPRDSRIASVKFAFDEPQEAAKFFDINATAQYVLVNPTVATATLTAKLADDVDLTTGKVIVGMKAYIEDIWGRTMILPFNVEVSTK